MDIPNILDKLFINGDSTMSDRYASINRSKGNLNETPLFYIIEGYREATNLLLDKILEGEDRDWLKVDSLIFPLLFNFRHYLEIILKQTIRYYKLYKREIYSDEVGFVKDHSLTKLWTELHPYLKSNYQHVPNVDEDLQAVGNILEEFDTIDKGSFCFRYSFEGRKKPNAEIVYSVAPMTVDLENLQSVIKKTQNYFEGISWHIAALLDDALTINH